MRTQVIAYLRELMKDGHELHLLTFEPIAPTLDEQAEIRSGLGDIRWHWLRYHRRPSAPATLYDALNGVRFITHLMKTHEFDILHCRIHVPMLMAALARKWSSRKPKLLFDIRGFFPEEYTDAGVWPEGGLLYRTTKRVERWLMAEADGFVVLTTRARDILFPQTADTGRDERARPVEVIPCCVDIGRFEGVDNSREEMRSGLAIGSRFTIAYVGSFGGWYLTEEMFEFLAIAGESDPDVFVMILTQREPDRAAERLRSIGFRDRDFFAGSVSPEEIPAYLSAADAGISFIKNSFSKQASSPTKNAEYLASGLPIIANAGVGDVDEVIKTDSIGVIIDELKADGYRRAFQQVREMGDISERCRASAKVRFDLQSVGGARYRRLYRRLLA
ncbi:MAG: glycosyltransferase family 4 protein [Pyrinomonadaceae bacterium]